MLGAGDGARLCCAAASLCSTHAARCKLCTSQTAGRVTQCVSEVEAVARVCLPRATVVLDAGRARRG
ncbi:hypothetical protein EON64_08730 [archaeon]|nr:MAG: hypothetical protein EON64_08730 [archaeon]